MSVQINDCTIRDGGYLLGKDPDPEYVSGVFGGLLEAGIDVIEIGFLQNVSAGESVVYGNSIEALRYVPASGFSSRFTGFCDNSRYSLGKLEKCGEGAFDYLKISFAKHELEEALEFVEGAVAKGYKVFANPMDALAYSSDELSAVIKRINQIGPYCFSIVDTFGAMYLDDLERIFQQMNLELRSDVRIGLHSHNNLQLSSALAELLIDMAEKANRDVVVDASLYGMGRGAGNASTEIIAAYLNRKYGLRYKLDVLFDTIDSYIAPLCLRGLWGYDLPMLACGLLGAHVDNVFHMRLNPNLSSREQYEALRRLSPGERKRYGIAYNKGDFSILDRVLANGADCEDE